MKNRFIALLKDIWLNISQGAIELAVNIISLILVERYLGINSLGAYSFFLSIYYLSHFISEFGIPSYLQSNNAKKHPADKVIVLNDKESELVKNSSKAIVMLGFITMILMFFYSGSYISYERVHPGFFSIILIGITIPIRSFNEYRIAFLNSLNQHILVAKLKTKKRIQFLVLFFIAMQILNHSSISIHLIFIVFFISELIHGFALGKKTKIKFIRSISLNIKNLYLTAKQSHVHMFTDNSLQMVLFLDFLVLGFFVNSYELGMYSIAAIYVRILLIIPITSKPIIKQKLLSYDPKKEKAEISSLIKNLSTIYFFLNSLLLLIILLYFDQITQIIGSSTDYSMAYYIFSIMAPGLIFLVSLMPFESVYEIEEKVENLQILLLGIFSTNLLLNLYLIPFAGTSGAAAASTISMVLYFAFFERFQKTKHIPKGKYLLAGIGLYLIFKALNYLHLSILLTLITIIFSTIFLFIVNEIIEFKQLSIRGEKHHGE